MGTYSVKAGGGWESPGNLATDPGVLTTDDRAPSSRGGGGEKQARQQTPDFATPRHPRASARRSMGGTAAEAALARPQPIGAPLARCRGVMRHQVRTVGTHS